MTSPPRVRQPSGRWVGRLALAALLLAVGGACQSAPADLEGKQLAVTPGAVDEIMWPVFARKTRLDARKVTLLNVDATAKATLMRNGQADGAFHLVPTDATIYEASGFPVAALRYSDFGLSRLGTGIVARGQTLREKPD